VLELNAITFSFPGRDFAFDLKVETGNLVAIIGPSGGGKSTLLHLIAGFETPTRGTISFDVDDITHRHPGQRPLTIIFQDNNLFPHLTVRENAALGLSTARKLTPEQNARLDAALENVSLSSLQSKRPGELSGGERQRAAIARAFLRDKPLLLLDEAFAALGPALRKDMLHLIKDLHNSKGLTTMLVTHHPEDARAIASHVAFFADGRIKAFGPTAEVLADRSHIELQSYLGEVSQSR
jgi:thiamine transport system ATP-binding protein